MKVAILGTRGIPASYSGFETAAEQLASRLTAARPRGHRLLPPARRRPPPERAQGRAARPPADDPQQVPRHVHATRSSARCTARAGVRPTSRCSSSPATARCASITRGAGIPTVINVDGLDSDRSQVARARQGLPALRRAQRAALVGHARSPTRTRSPRSSSSATASGSASCPTASRTPATTGTETLERLGLEPRKYVLFVGRLEPENNPHVLVEAFSAHLRRARARHEARRRRRRAVRARLHQAGPARGRPARRLPRLRLRPRLLGAAAPRLRVLRADRGRRHAPGHPRGARRRQLRARQRPRAERRDGRRRRR